MSEVDPQNWAEDIARNLSYGGERVPFQRVLRAHQYGLDALRARGLTWQSLAHLLSRAGVRRPSGQPYTANHLRICATRLGPSVGDGGFGRPLSSARRRSSRPAATSTAPTNVGGRGRASAPRSQESTSHRSQTDTVADDKDVSVDEIAAARARLRQTP
ncbi:hypothetical protein ABIE45_004698 [Methylobacterium sp. OAE515]|uniref:hypothetical protein n=1 Tax=Methylobacterium sp. OAE515 TaxID=2817895 RepID=UPI00178AA5C6